jgi:aminoglycoside phosphotransferase (APT) family kinase protein
VCPESPGKVVARPKRVRATLPSSQFLFEPSFMLDDHHTAKLQDWIAGKLGASDLIVEAVRPLGGGSIQENWRVRCVMDRGQKTREFVLRKDAPATIASSLPRSEEFAVLAAAYRAGVCVPEPIGFCGDPDVIGAPFALMGLVEGVGLGPRIAPGPSHRQGPDPRRRPHPPRRATRARTGENSYHSPAPRGLGLSGRA